MIQAMKDSQRKHDSDDFYLTYFMSCLQRKSEKCTKNRGARAEPSFLLTNPFVFGRVLVA